MEDALIHLPPAFLLINILLLTDICDDKNTTQFIVQFEEYYLNLFTV